MRSRAPDLRLTHWLVRSERGLGPRNLGGEARRGADAPLRIYLKTSRGSQVTIQGKKITSIIPMSWIATKGMIPR